MNILSYPLRSMFVGSISVFNTESLAKKSSVIGESRSFDSHAYDPL